jgi:D-lactate dehydrogenase (cytochrome)
MQVNNRSENIEDYFSDAGNMPGGYADRVYFPENLDELRAVVIEASTAGIPLTISGARTGTVGGAVPFGGVVVSTERMHRIKAVDIEKSFVIVEPGVVLADLQREVESKGLFYPPDPTEWSCQIGGTVATNASGARTFKYGPTRDYVNALTVVLADGDIVKIRRGECFAEAGTVRIPIQSGRIIEAKIPTYKRPEVRKNVSGYFAAPGMDAIDLFIGSEGTLGIIAEIELRLLPRPKGNISGIVFFSEEACLLDFVDYVRRCSLSSRNSDKGIINATLLEYFDERSLALISEKFPETPSGMAGAIFFEQETTPETEDDIFSEYSEALEKFNAALDKSWFATNPNDREKMRAFRHALPVAVNERVVRNRQKKIGTDMAVPDDKFKSFFRFYKSILDASGIEYVIFGHIGDCHLHANLLPADEAQAKRASHIYGRAVAQAVMLGGCVSAEHGIGKMKRKYLYVMMGERYINEMAELKQAFDPKGILGRGNMFDESVLQN